MGPREQLFNITPAQFWQYRNRIAPNRLPDPTDWYGSKYFTLPNENWTGAASARNTQRILGFTAFVWRRRSRGIEVVLSFSVTAKSDDRLIIQDAGRRSGGRSRKKVGGLLEMRVVTKAVILMRKAEDFNDSLRSAR
jgi:hypothetical protein